MNWVQKNSLILILLLCLLSGCQNATEAVVPLGNQVTEVVMAEEVANLPSATTTKSPPEPTFTHSPTIPPAPTRTPRLEATREATESNRELVATEGPTEVPPTATATQEPATATQEPATATQEPATATQEPATATATEVPVTATEVPVTATEVPVTATEVPVTATEVPVTATEVPVTATEVLVTATEVPATEVPATEVPATATSVPTTVVPTSDHAPTVTQVPPTEVPTSVSPTAIGPTPAPPTPPPPVISSSATGTQPVLLMIPRLGVNAGIESVGQTASGAMDVPHNVHSVGWYNLGVRPGEMGNAVLSGHFDDYKQDPAVFWRLHELAVGDLIIVRDAQGREHRYEVIGQEIYPFDRAPLNRIFGMTTNHNLNLITCNGTWDESAWNYDKRLVVYTRQIYY